MKQEIKVGDRVVHIKDVCNEISIVTSVNPDGTIWTTSGRGDAVDFKKVTN